MLIVRKRIKLPTASNEFDIRFIHLLRLEDDEVFESTLFIHVGLWQYVVDTHLVCVDVRPSFVRIWLFLLETTILKERNKISKISVRSTFTLLFVMATS